MLGLGKRSIGLLQALGGKTMSPSEEHHDDRENGGTLSDPRRKDLEELLHTVVFGAIGGSFPGVWRKREILLSSFSDYISLAIVYLLAITAAMRFGRFFLKPEKGIWSRRNIVVLFLSSAIAFSTIMLYKIIMKYLAST